MSFAYRAFGETQIVTRMAMLAISLSCGGLVGLIAAEVADRRAALYSMLAFWCMPVMFYFGEMSKIARHFLRR